MSNKVLNKILAKLPSHFRITQDVTYEVVFIDNFKSEKQVGECRPDVKQIVIKKGQTPTESIKTVIHEWIHSLALENEFELTEKQVLKLEEAIFRSVKLNKLFDLIAKLC